MNPILLSIRGIIVVIKLLLKINLTDETFIVETPRNWGSEVFNLKTKWSKNDDKPRVFCRLVKV